MWERYNVIKEFYPNYLILFYKKEKIIAIGIDKEIKENFDIRRTNKIILNNLDIEKMEEYEHNDYSFLYIKVKLIKLIKEMI